MEDTLNNTDRNAERTKLLKVGVVLAMVLTLFVAVLTVNEIKKFGYIGGDVPPQGTISVSGKGEVFAVPDTAMVSFSVIEEADTSDAAQDAASERMSAVLTELESLGVAEEDIKTTSYMLNPRYEFRQKACAPGQFCPPRGKRVLEGFELRQSVEVKVEDREVATDVVAALGDVGVQQIGQIRFTIDEPEELQAEARSLAIVDAKAKAKKLMDELGVSKGRIVSFNEQDRSPYPMYRQAATLGMSGDAESSAEPQLPAGENKFTSRVMITYEIR